MICCFCLYRECFLGDVAFIDVLFFVFCVMLFVLMCCFMGVDVVVACMRVVVLLLIKYYWSCFYMFGFACCVIYACYCFRCLSDGLFLGLGELWFHVLLYVRVRFVGHLVCC